jgi:hypothetical protein
MDYKIFSDTVVAVAAAGGAPLEEFAMPVQELT